MSALEELYRAHVGTVFRFSMRLVGRREVAEDITSEVFLALLRNIDAVDTDRLPAWLFTVARNQAMDYWRHRSVEQRYVAESRAAPAVEESAPESWLFESESLKPIHRVCLVLRYVEGMSRAEIARKMDLSETQVKRYLQYARHLLRKELANTSR